MLGTLLYPLQAARLLCDLYLLLEGEVIVELPLYFLLGRELHKKKLQEVDKAMFAVDEPLGYAIIL